MTDKQLKRLNRRQLLELLLIQTEQNEQLQKQLAQVQAQLDEKIIKIREAGTLAEACLRLSGIFEAADRAAAEYLQNIQSRATAEYLQILQDPQVQAETEAPQPGGEEVRP